MRRVLVTGGAGFIGSNFTRYILDEEQDVRIVVLDALTYAGNLQSLADVMDDERLRFVHGNICDESRVTEILVSEQINTIVHFAAESHVDRSIEGPDEFVTTNVVGTVTLLNAAREVWKEKSPKKDTVPFRFHHVSTDEVYGTLAQDDPAFTESTRYSPNSPYAASKAASDHFVRAFSKTYRIPITISNCSNNYGPYQFPEKLIPLMIIRALQGESLPIYGDGTNIRDWLHVSDHCRAILAILRSGRLGATYNVGGNCELNNRELVRRLCSIIDDMFEDDELRRAYPDSPAARGNNTESLIEFVKDRPAHDWRYAIDDSRIREDLGFKPEIDLDDGLRSTVNWILSNKPWWQAVISGEYRNWIARHYSGQQSAHSNVK